MHAHALLSYRRVAGEGQHPANTLEITGLREHAGGGRTQERRVGRQAEAGLGAKDPGCSRPWGLPCCVGQEKPLSTLEPHLST